LLGWIYLGLLISEKTVFRQLLSDDAPGATRRANQSISAYLFGFKPPNMLGILDNHPILTGTRINVLESTKQF
jgi:hypothetical protein